MNEPNTTTSRREDTLPPFEPTAAWLTTVAEQMKTWGGHTIGLNQGQMQALAERMLELQSMYGTDWS